MTSLREKKQVPRSIMGFTFFLAKEIIAQKKWLLFPLWILIAAVALVIVVGGGSTVLPAIYIAF